MNRTIHHRSGFTLIELLVVIAILSVLAALSAGTFFRIRNSQQISSTEATLSKLNSGLERFWTAERDQAEKEFNNNKLLGNSSYDRLLTYAGGPNERERAKSIYLYYRLRYEFPQTFAAARSNLDFKPASVPVNSTPILQFPPKNMFTQSLPASTTASNNTQSAIILYTILSEKSSRGETFDMDSLNAFVADVAVNSATPPLTKRAVIDSWGTPITFIRYLTNAEIDNQPFARSPAGGLNNPFDVSGKWGSTGTAPWNAGRLSEFCTAANIDSAIIRQNFLPSVISAGANKTWDGLDTGGTASINQNTASADGNDNIYGYRLRKFGGRGD